MSTTHDSPDDRRRQQISQALAALQRARQRAERLAASTGTRLVLWRDGEIVLVEPAPIAAEGEAGDHPERPA